MWAIITVSCLFPLVLTSTFLNHHNKYSGIPISQTNKGRENWFKKSRVKLQYSTE